jgi:S-formylglutathione hydrolase
VPWGEKAFAAYLGPDRAAWAEWDAAMLMRRRPYPGPILVDQGGADVFLTVQLRPETLTDAAAASGQALTLRLQPGYDHSYWFIQSFVGDHLKHHAEHLLA